MTPFRFAFTCYMFTLALITIYLGLQVAYATGIGPFQKVTVGDYYHANFPGNFGEA